MIAYRRFLLLLVILVTQYIPVFAQQDPSSGVMQLDAVARTFEAISQSNAYTESLTSASQNVLPVGIKRTVGNMEVVIAVDKAVFHPEYTELSVFAKITLLQASKKKEKVLFFGARGIKLSYEGSIIGDANLALLGDIEIPFNNGNMSIVLLGDYNTATGNSRSKTYMSIDCKGFRELGLDAEVRFPATLMEKVQPDGSVDMSDRTVSGHFSTVISDWNDIIADITLPSFRIVGLDGFSFNLQNVVLDFSDARNDDNVRFPAGYEGKYMIPGAATLWRGVYARNIEVTLPKAFNDVSDRPARFSANNLLIDDNGVTGLFTAENILTFENGSASGWNFSVSRFGIELEANKLVAAGFGGQIGLPFNGQKTRLDYDALIMENNEYLMSVSSVDTIDFSVFNARAKINPNSWLKLHVIEGRFRPEALLHGSMSIAPDKETPVSVPSLKFRSLRLKTEDPYISVEYLGYEGKVSLGAFPVSLNNISMRSYGGGNVELSAGIEVALGQDLFNGSTNVSFLASLNDNGGRRKWHFDGVRLGEIAVEASIAEALELKGKLGWRRNDPIYGDGMYGALSVKVKPCGNLTVDMRGCFGSVDDYRYWFMEGGVVLPAGIPVAGPLEIKGFSGGVSRKMIGTGRTQEGGGTFSTAVYVPDKRVALGLKASVLLDIAKIASGEACFDIAFTDRGGLAYIGFYGYAKFAGKLVDKTGGSDKYNAILKKEQEYASDLSKLQALKQFEPNKAAEIVSPMPKNMNAGLMGTVGIQYDFRNHSFHAQTELYLNTPGGFLTGISDGGKAGWGVIHFDPDEWYMHLGSPSNRIGIKLNLGKILALRLGSYFMAGSRIPDMPAPPAELASILREDLSKLTLGRNLEGLSTGRGFAFGSDFQIRTGDITFLMLYANFLAGLGFDIMFKDYGDLECAQNPGRKMGIDGWYAMGQTYAYLQGELGVKVNLWFIKMKFPIIKGSAATLMQAMLPNPSSFKGYLGVNVNVLGLIKGNMRFKLSLGDECDPIIPGGSPLQMAMISDVAPGDGDSEVSVFTMPQTTFNMSIGTSFESEDDAGTHTYRIQLKSFTVRDDKGEVINGTLKWNASKDAVSFQAKEILPPNTALMAEAKVCFDKFENGAWKTVFTSGKEAIETKSCSFTTGGAPDNIPLQNIIWAYPVVGQKYFLTGESRKGFTQLQFGQKYLFGRGFDYKLMFTDENGGEIPTDFVYNEQENRLEYALPEMGKERQYTLMLTYMPDAAENTTAGGNSQPAGRQIINSEEEGTLNVEKRTASAGINTSIRKSILDYDFATSRHATFVDKMGTIKTDGNSVAEDAGLSFRFLYKVRAEEPFDEAEIAGVDKSGWKSLVQPTAELKEPFFTETVIPMVYGGYPFGTIRLQYRDDQVIGVPPVRSVFAYEPYLNLIADGGRPATFFFPFSYESAIVAERDFRDLQSQVVNNRQSVATAVYQRFATGRLPFIKYGKYKTVLRYVLPDGTVTSSYDFYFDNFLRFNE